MSNRLVLRNRVYPHGEVAINNLTKLGVGIIIYIFFQHFIFMNNNKMNIA